MTRTRPPPCSAPGQAGRLGPGRHVLAGHAQRRAGRARPGPRRSWCAPSTGGASSTPSARRTTRPRCGPNSRRPGCGTSSSSPGSTGHPRAPGWPGSSRTPSCGRRTSCSSTTCPPTSARRATTPPASRRPAPRSSSASSASPSWPGKDDRGLTRLHQYRVLERKLVDRRAADGSHEEFLRSCDIRVSVHEDTAGRARPAARAGLRTNQLNFTKRSARPGTSSPPCSPTPVWRPATSGSPTATATTGSAGSTPSTARPGVLVDFLFSCRVHEHGGRAVAVRAPRPARARLRRRHEGRLSLTPPSTGSPLDDGSGVRPSAGRTGPGRDRSAAGGS